MTTNLTEDERKVWEDAYRLHEEFHDMKGTDLEWIQLLQKTVRGIEAHSGNAHRLAYKLMMAFYDYMSEEQKIRQDAAAAEPQPEQPEQIRMEGILWT